MNVKSLIASVFGTIIKIALAIVIILGIYRGAVMAYDYGYRIFEEEPMSSGEGRQVVVTIPEGMTAGEMGSLFLQKGLIRDDKLFILQYYLSEYRRDILPGTFTLSTSMTVEEMMETMTVEPAEETEEEDTGDPAEEQ